MCEEVMSKKVRDKKERFATALAFCLASAVYAVGLIGYFWNPTLVIKASEMSLIPLSLSHFTTTGERNTQDSQTLPPKQKPQKHTKHTQKAISKPEQRLPQEVEAHKKIESAKVSQSQQGVASQASSAGEIDAYMKYVYEMIAKHYTLPKALRGRKDGEVKMSFKIDMSGAIFDIQVISSSGYAEIDNAAIKVLQSINGKLKKPSKPYTMSITFGLTL